MSCRVFACIALNNYSLQRSTTHAAEMLYSGWEQSLQGFQLREETDLHRATHIASISVLNGRVMKIDIHLALKGMFCTIHWTAGGCDWPSMLLFHTSCSPDHISKHVCGMRAIKAASWIFPRCFTFKCKRKLSSSRRPQALLPHFLNSPHHILFSAIYG